MLKLTMNLKAWAKKLKIEIHALALAFKHAKTPMHAKVFLACALAYALSPIDLIPDFIPVLGYLDDLILLPICILIAIRLVPNDVMLECRVLAQSATAPKKNKAGILLVALIWLLCIVFMVMLFLRIRHLAM